MSKKRNLFALLICLVLTFVCLVSCVEVTLSPELAARQQAETDAQEVLGKLVWDDEDREKIVSSLSFATENRNYPGVKISWSSSEEDIISSTGKVNRTDSDDPRNVLVGEDLVAEVVVTATVVAEYSWEGDAGVQSASTEPISKQFVFTVLAKPEGTDTGTIADVKLRAWNYVFVEQGVDKALVSNSSVTYNVLLSGVITAKLQAEGATKGFMLHDGTDGIYVYGDNTKFNVGDSVEVIGGIYSYYGSLQVGSNVSVSKSNVKVTLPEYTEVTPQAWEDQNKDLGDDVIGHLGGDLYKVEGYLTAASNNTTSDEFCITDANTGEVAWIYYKSYTPEMKAELEKYVGKYVKVTGLGYDRDSRILKNHLLWDGGIEEATAPVVDDQTKANVALSQITLQDSYTEDFDLNQNGVWEIVSGTGIEIVEGVAKVTRGEEDQVVVLKVTVTVGEATASKELTVTIKKVVQQQPTIEYITISEAIALGSAQDHNTYTEEKYYIKGTVTGFYNTTYGNFYVTDGTNQICVYGLYSEDGSTRYDKMEVKPVDGDEVIIYGVIGQYNGTPQFKNAWFMGFYEESKYDCISIEEAIALGSAKEHNTYTEEKYYVKGTVTGFYNTTYGNFYLTDGTNQICVYGLYSEDGSTRYDKMEVKPVDGDEIVVYGVLGQYNGSPQFKNAWLMEIVGGETPAPHEHKFVNGKCECGEKDPNYVEPPVSGNEIVFDFTAGGTSMESSYNAAEAEMTVNGYVFGYLQMKASGYSGSNFLMFCKSTEAHLYNKTAFASPIVKVEVTIPSGASGTAGYFLSLHKAAASGNIVSDTKFVGNNASFSIEATEADGYTFFNLSSDSTTGKNGQLAKIVVTLANGSVVVPPVHEHKFVDGKCECGEKDPNYVEPETPTFGVVTEFKENVAYKFGLLQGNTGKTIFVTGNYKNTYYGESTEDVAAAADVYVVAVDGGYNLKLVKADGTVLYINVVASGTHRNIKFEAAASSVYTYNAELNTFTTLVEGTEYYIGTYGTYDTISPSSVDKAATSFVGHLYGGVQAEEPEHEHKFVDGKCECGEKDPNYVEPETPAFGVVTEFKENVAYKFGLLQGNTGKTIFVTGNYKNTYYGESTEDVAAAADVYVVAVAGGYNLKLVKADGTVLYINVVASGTHRNIKFEAAASSVYTYNAELNTFTTLVEGTEYYIGTYGTYDTISPSSVDKAATSFVGHLYGGVQAEEPEHEHKFVDGKCECGEEDPNYVAPVAANKADLDTLNGGKASSSYADYTSTNGWTVTGCAINSGNANASATVNPSFGCLGGADERAVTLNGGTDKTLGTVKSAVLSGGLSKLSFNYTNLFTDTKFSVTVYIKDAQGNVLKEEVVSYDNPNKVKYEVRTYELEFAVEGDFIIEIVNNRPNGLSGNKDRATIWNIQWESAK